MLDTNVKPKWVQRHKWNELDGTAHEEARIRDGYNLGVDELGGWAMRPYTSRLNGGKKLQSVFQRRLLTRCSPSVAVTATGKLRPGWSAHGRSCASAKARRSSSWSKKTPSTAHFKPGSLRPKRMPTERCGGNAGLRRRHRHSARANVCFSHFIAVRPISRRPRVCASRGACEKRAMSTIHRCYCGAPAEIGVPVEDGVRWLCQTHSPWQCVGCGPESDDEDNYPVAVIDE